MFEYYNISENDIQDLEKKVKKLNKRAVKIGCPELEIEITNEHYRKIDHDDNDVPLVNPYYIKVWDVFIHGETPKYDGWKFVAVITGYPSGDNVVHKSPFIGDVDVSKYRNEKSFCDHCKTRRYRKHTYIVLNEETQEMLQVGSTCIKDFLGHPAPSFSHFAKMMKDLEDMEFGYNFTGPRFFNLKTYIKTSCEIIGKYGFISKKKAYEEGGSSTADFVDYVINGRPEYEKDREVRELMTNPVSEESAEMAEKIIEWGKSLKERENLNEYMHTLSVIFDNELLDSRSIGIVVSAVQAYKNEMGLNQEKKSGYNPKNSEHFGEIKKRYEMVLILDKQLDFASDYGPVTFHIMHDEESENQFVWYSSGKSLNVKGESVEIGDKVKIKGTVKKHVEYKGIKQTVINRVTGIEFVERSNG